MNMDKTKKYCLQLFYLQCSNFHDCYTLQKPKHTEIILVTKSFPKEKT